MSLFRKKVTRCVVYGLTLIYVVGFCFVPQAQATATFPTDGRVLWFGTNANIPANWSEDTNFSSKYLQGGASDFSAPANGGSSLHDHIMPAHTHGGSSHTHVSSSGTPSGGSCFAFVTIAPRPTVVTPTTPCSHSHGNRTSPTATMSYGNSAAKTLSTTGGAALAVRPLLIKPDDGSQDIPDGACCYTDETSAPTGFSTYASMAGNYMYIQANGGDGSTTQVGAATHQHTSNPPHDHPIAAHTHSGHVLGAGTNQELADGTKTVTVYPRTHHSGSYDAGGSGTSNTAAPDSDVVSNDPAYVKLLAVQNTSGSATTPDDVVIMFIGAVGNIPSGWTLMDGTGESNYSCIDKQVKATTTAGEVGDTGGSNTHTHDMAHTHLPGFTHTHTITISATGSTHLAVPGLAAVRDENSSHTHTWTITSAGNVASDSNNATTDAGDARWHYRTILYIKKIPVAFIPRIFFMFITSMSFWRWC